MTRLLACLVLAAAASAAAAAPRTVTLSVSGMTCAACPLTVKKALTKVEGVTQAEVSYERGEAIVTFDDRKASVQQLTKASADAGYPATVKP